MKRGAAAVSALALLSVAAGDLSAQERPAPEIGIYASITRFSTQHSDRTVVQFPGGGPGPVAILPVVYGTFFVSERDAIESHGGFVWTGGGGGSNWVLALGGQLAHFFDDAGDDAPYAFVHGAMLDAERGEAQFAVGGGTGYRWTVNQNVGVRLEGRYRRWFDLEANELTVGVGLGVILREN